MAFRWFPSVSSVEWRAVGVGSGIFPICIATVVFGYIDSLVFLIFGAGLVSGFVTGLFGSDARTGGWHGLLLCGSIWAWSCIGIAWVGLTAGVSIVIVDIIGLAVSNSAAGLLASVGGRLVATGRTLWPKHS